MFEINFYDIYWMKIKCYLNSQFLQHYMFDKRVVLQNLEWYNFVPAGSYCKFEAGNKNVMLITFKIDNLNISIY